MENEIYDIPFQARLCYEKNKGLILPEKVPYIGMGSSYFATVVLRYLGVKIFPEIAGDFFYYLQGIKQFDQAVLISQSGRTTDLINCASCFREYVAIVNDTDSPIARQANLKLLVPIYAGNEKFSSTKTFINTLVVLYLGHGFDVRKTIDSIEKKFSDFELTGKSIGTLLIKNLRNKRVSCVNIIGSGPNVGTAYQAALMLSETTRFPFIAMSLTQYEHGYKETAENAVVIVINPSKGVLYDRTVKLMGTLRRAGAKVFEVNDPESDEIYSPFSSVLPFFFMAQFLASKLGVGDPFVIGSKITERKEE
jgi:glucosamine--fructose-6-phosphate aminotransferase (isomerizing)